MKKWITTLGIVLLSTLIALPVLAGPGKGKGNGWGHGSCWKGFDTSKNLTEEQQAQLEVLHDDFYADTAQIRHELWAKTDELGILLDRSEPDLKTAKALQKDISELRGRMAQKRLERDIEARKIAPDASLGRRHGKGPHGRRHMMGGQGGGHPWGGSQGSRHPCGY